MSVLFFSICIFLALSAPHVSDKMSKKEVIGWQIFYVLLGAISLISI